MIINLCYLKFHSFKYDSDYNNQWKNSKEVSSKIINKDTKNQFCHIKHEINNITSLLSSKNNHWLDQEHKIKLFKIIKSCHPNLNENLEQSFLIKNKISELNIFQLRINKRSRIICLFFEDIIYPLIFDLKHVFYPIKDYNFDNNYKHENKDWDFKQNQNSIKQQLLD